MKTNLFGFCMFLVFAACNTTKSKDNLTSSSSEVTSDTGVSSVNGDTNLITKEDAAAYLQKVIDSLNKINQYKLDSTNKAKIDSVNKAKDARPLTSRTPISIPPDNQKASYMLNIDWLWHTNDAPKRMYCLAYIVTGGGAPKLRGNATAHDCVVNAIQAYKDENLDLCISWLCAGQCHNPAAQDDIRRAGVMAAQYAYQEYGKGL